MSRLGADVSTGALPMSLTPQDVAEMLHVHERTVLRWAQHDASMPAIRVGRVVRFERDPLLRWLAKKRPRSGGQFRPCVNDGDPAAP